MENRIRRDICGKTLGSSTAFEYHQVIQSGERHFRCNMCRREFRSSSQLYRHERNVEGVYLETARFHMTTVGILFVKREDKPVTFERRFSDHTVDFLLIMGSAISANKDFSCAQCRRRFATLAVTGWPPKTFFAKITNGRGPSQLPRWRKRFYTSFSSKNWFVWNVYAVLWP